MKHAAASGPSRHLVTSTLGVTLILAWGSSYHLPAVLAGSSVLLAAGLVLLALSSSLPAYPCAWAVMSAGMSAGLYNAAFAVMGHLYGQDARGPTTTLTLRAGFASTH